MTIHFARLGSRIRDAWRLRVTSIKRNIHLAVGAVVLAVVSGVAFAPSASAAGIEAKCDWKDKVASPVDDLIGNALGFGQWAGGRLLILIVVVATIAAVSKWGTTLAKKAGIVFGGLLVIGILLSFIDVIDGKC